MQIVELARRLSYSSYLGGSVRRLGLRPVFQHLYAAVRGNPGVQKISLSGMEAMFSSRTPLELRCVEGTWFLERKMLDGVTSVLRAGDVFLDVGSNLGMFTVFAAKAVGSHGKVLAFEPESIAYRRLEENVRLNGLNNVTLFKVALSDGLAAKRLSLGDPEAVSQSAHLSNADGPSEVVSCSDFDSLTSSMLLPIPRVVKVDIEGHEFAALRGMRIALSNPICSFLFCEVHPNALPAEVSVDDVVGLIESFGFDSIQSEQRCAQIQIIAKKTKLLDRYEQRFGER